MFLIGIDIGTSSCKVTLYNPDGSIVGKESAEYIVETPREGWVELDHLKVFRVLKPMVGQLISNFGEGETEYLMSFSILGDSVIPCDESGNSLSDAVLPLDNRSFSKVKKMKEDFDLRDLYQISGRVPHTMAAITRIMWLLDNFSSPDSEVKLFLDLQSWLMNKLGFYPVTDFSSIAGSMLFDIEEREYSKRMLDYLGIGKENLPDLAKTGKVLGKLSRGVSSDFGFPDDAEVEVILGAIDQVCNAIGTATVEPEDTVCSTGTVEATTTILPKDFTNAELFPGKLPITPTAVPDLYAVFTILWSGGGALRWFRDTLGRYEKKLAKKEGKDVYDLLVKQSEDSFSKVFFLPHLAGSGTPAWNPISKGAFLGLSLATSKNDMIQALLEGITFELRENLENLEDVGIDPESISVIGGGAKSNRWLQLKADILRTEIRTLKNKEAGCLGAAILAGVSAGEYDSIKTASSELIEVDKKFYPDEERAEFYDEKYQIHKTIYQELRDLNRRVDGLEV